MPKTVVARSFLRITEHAIGFGGFLELLFGLGITGIFIGMMLYCKLPIGAFDFLIRAGVGYPQHFVIVSFIQSYSPSQLRVFNFQPPSMNAPSTRTES